MWWAVAMLAALPPLPVYAQMATADRVEAQGWWPTKRTSAAGDYVGSGECVRCHRTRATQLTTSMARTASRAADAAALRARAEWQFALGRYLFSIAPSSRDPIYTVTNGTHTRSVRLAWAFGAGTVGQTYLFEDDRGLHEARVSYYHSVRRLDFTPNRALTDPRDVEEAMARPIDDHEARRCFGCHTTASTTRTGFDPATLTPGVTCEACHGPGRAHVTSIERGGPRKGRETILNPAALDAVDSVDFCGACHATFWDVRLANERGLALLRSQPYRLQSSRCWGQGDDRLTCVACHDPHKPLVRGAAAYDARCLACHVEAGSAPTAGRPGRACQVAASTCTSCHMPSYDVPAMHYRFTDHFIRIVRPTSPTGRREGDNR
jgi:hypothetical protein